MSPIESTRWMERVPSGHYEGNLVQLRVIILTIITFLINVVHSSYYPVNTDTPFPFGSIGGTGMTHAVKGGWMFFKHQEVISRSMLNEYEISPYVSSGVTYYYITFYVGGGSYLYYAQGRWTFMISVYGIDENSNQGNLEAILSSANDTTTVDLSSVGTNYISFEEEMGIDSANRMLLFGSNIQFQDNPNILFAKLFYAYIDSVLFSSFLGHNINNLMLGSSEKFKFLLPTYKLDFNELDLSNESPQDLEDHLSRISNKGYILNTYDTLYRINGQIELGKTDPMKDIDLGGVISYRIFIEDIHSEDSIQFGFQNSVTFSNIFEFSDATFSPITISKLPGSSPKTYNIQFRIYYFTLWSNYPITERPLLYETEVCDITDPDNYSVIYSKTNMLSLNIHLGPENFGGPEKFTFGIKLKSQINVNPNLNSHIYVTKAIYSKGGLEAGMWLGIDTSFSNADYTTVTYGASFSTPANPKNFDGRPDHFMDTTTNMCIDQFSINIPNGLIPKNSTAGYSCDNFYDENSYSGPPSGPCDPNTYVVGANGQSCSRCFNYPVINPLIGINHILGSQYGMSGGNKGDHTGKGIDYQPGYYLFEPDPNGGQNGSIPNFYRDDVLRKYVNGPPNGPDGEARPNHVGLEGPTSEGVIVNNECIKGIKEDDFKNNIDIGTQNNITRFIDWDIKLEPLIVNERKSREKFIVSIIISETSPMFTGVNLPENMANWFNITISETTLTIEKSNITIEFKIQTELIKNSILTVDLQSLRSNLLEEEEVYYEAYLVDKSVTLSYSAGYTDNEVNNKIGSFGVKVIQSVNYVTKAATGIVIIGTAINANFGGSFIKLFQIIEIFGKFYFTPIEFSEYIELLLNGIYNFSELISLNKDSIIPVQKNQPTRYYYKITNNNEQKYMLRSVPLVVILYFGVFFLKYILLVIGIFYDYWNHIKIKRATNNICSFILEMSFVDFAFYSSYGLIGHWDFNYMDFNYVLNKVICLTILSKCVYEIVKLWDVAFNFKKYQKQLKSFYIITKIEEGLSNKPHEHIYVYLLNPIFMTKLLLYQAVLSSLQNFSADGTGGILLISIGMTVHFTYTLTRYKPFKSFFEAITRICLELSILMFGLVMGVNYLEGMHSIVNNSAVMFLEQTVFILILATIACQIFTVLIDAIMTLKAYIQKLKKKEKNSLIVPKQLEPISQVGQFNEIGIEKAENFFNAKPRNQERKNRFVQVSLSKGNANNIYVMKNQKKFSESKSIKKFIYKKSLALSSVNLKNSINIKKKTCLNKLKGASSTKLIVKNELKGKNHNCKKINLYTKNPKQILVQDNNFN